MSVLLEDGIPTLPFCYRAKVVSTSDLDPGLCRIQIAGMHDGLSPTKCPVAEPAYPVFGGSVDSGAYWKPVVGCWVWVFFDGGNIQSPVYFALATNSEAAKKQIEEETLLNVDAPSLALHGEGQVRHQATGLMIIKGSQIILN